MDRAYSTLFYCSYSSQRIEIRCYKIERAYGFFLAATYSYSFIRKNKLNPLNKNATNERESLNLKQTK